MPTPATALFISTLAWCGVRWRNSPRSSLCAATCTLSTEEFGPVASAVAWTLEGERYVLPGTQQGDTYTFPVPESEVSSVVLSGRLRPVVEWEMDVAAAPGLTRRLKLKITNVNAEPLSGSAELRPPSGWRTPAAVRFGPLATGESTELILPVTVPPNAELGRHHVWCEVRTPAGTFSAYQYIVVNQPVLADLRGNPGTYHLWLRNLGMNTVTGTFTCSVPRPLTVECPGEFTLPPRQEMTVPITVEGNDQLSEISELQAQVQIGDRQIDLVRGIMPAVPNGDFETDSAGDMKPDWWMCRKLQDRWSYERIHLSDDAHSGRYCLLLDPPQPGEEFIRAYALNGALKPDTRYRVSVWIKSASPDGVYATVYGRWLGNGKTSDKWQQFTAEFTTDPDRLSPSCYLYNRSDSPAFFDDLLITELE